jgi:hypothetical protein
MLDEDNLAAGPASANSVHVGAAALVGHERSENNGRPKLDRKQRVVRAPGNRSEIRPVRIGRMPQTASLIAQSPSTTPAIRPAPETGPAPIPQPEAEPVVIGDVLAGVESRRAVNAETMKTVAELHVKFDAMKDSFETLEAHVSVGLAKSIAEMIQREVTTVEQQIAARYRYRTRYRLALGGILALVGMIVVDHSYPFFDRAAALVGY